MKIKIILGNVKEYLIARSIIKYLNHEFNNIPELSKNYRFYTRNKLLDVGWENLSMITLQKKDVNIFSKNSSNIYMSQLEMDEHIARWGSTGRGKTESFPVNGLVDKIFENYDTDPSVVHLYKEMRANIHNGYKSFDKKIQKNINLRIQCRGNEKLIYVYSTTHRYFSKITIIKKKMVAFSNNYNHSVESFKENIIFLALTNHYATNLESVIEQNISFKDKLTLTDMINI